LGIKITSKDAQKGEFIPKPKGDWAGILRIHFIDIVEDSYVIFRGKERMTPEIEKDWLRLKRILEKRL